VDSIAHDARTRTRDLVLAMSPDARIELAFSLADDDLQLFMLTHRCDRRSALDRLRRARRQGRTPSLAAGNGARCGSSS
jgi:hypothetical protein